MNWASGEIVGVLSFLLPGFVAAAIFYSLTSYPKPSPFDRVVQALIFTVLGKGITDAILFFCTVPDKELSGNNWEVLLSLAVAVVLGLLASYFLNRDTVHRCLRWLGVTRETSYPSEWYSAFSRHGDSYVTLHLKGERHLYGWPEEWLKPSGRGTLSNSRSRMVDQG